MIDSEKKALIKAIHESPLKGCFVEVGGQCVVAELLKVSGASNTIFYSEIPYSKQTQGYYAEDIRSVSTQMIANLISTTQNRYFNESINCYFASSFQINEFNNGTSHGYIGVKFSLPGFPKVQKIFHLSIHEAKYREEIIEIVNNTSLYILGELISFKNNKKRNLYIDQIISWDGNCLLSETLKTISESTQNAFAYFKENLECSRLEDFLRESLVGIIICKGSYNPVHNAHISMFEFLKNKYPNHAIAFSISTNTYGKGQVSLNNLEWRIKTLNKLGIPVLIYNKSLFSDMTQILREKNYKGEIIYPVGSDTFERIENDSMSLNYFQIECEKHPTKFIIFQRDRIKIFDYKFIESVSTSDFPITGLSSTDIRLKLESLQTNLPSEVYNNLNDYIKSLEPQ